MLRGYEANSTETSHTMRAMSPRAHPRVRAAGWVTVAAVLAACSSGTGVTTDSANLPGSPPPASTGAPPQTVVPPSTESTTGSSDAPGTTVAPGSTDVPGSSDAPGSTEVTEPP